MIMFSLLAIAGLAAHSQVANDGAIASSLIIAAHHPGTLSDLQVILAWAALISSALFCLSAAWLSERHQRAAPLLGLSTTGALYFVSTQAFSAGIIPAAWVALLTLTISVLWSIHATVLTLRLESHRLTPCAWTRGVTR